MNNWYIIRGGAQYGPYTAQQLSALKAQDGLFAGDEFLDGASGRRYSLKAAQHKWRTGKNGKPRRRHTGLIVLASILLVIGGLIGFFMLTKTSDHIIMGRRTTVAAAKISSAGGEVKVKDPGSISGMTIDVPKGAYSGSTSFKVSTRPISSNKLGSLFNAVTPMITIDNGHKFAKESMTVTVPINKADDEFAMGFYYNEKTGRLEGIPVASLDNSHITLLTNHFSDIVVSKVKYSQLNGVSVDTGFTPGIDDWEFTNYGSWVAQGGHCAGQSLSALWYFCEKYEGDGDKRLFGRFDNNNYGLKTPDLWQDDSNSYRFASVVQKVLNWTNIDNTLKKKLSNDSASLTMYAFTYAMVLTDDPQFVGIRGKEEAEDGTTTDAGHAIIAYKIDQGRIYVADPNYPGEDDRYIQFNGSSFLPYSSGSNAAEIEAGNDIAFTDIYYFAQSALINFDTIQSEYEKMLKGTVGNAEFPKYKLEVLKSFDPTTSAMVWEPCPDVIKTDSIQTAKVAEQYRGKLVFRVSAAYSNFDSRLYKGLYSNTPVESYSPDDQHNVYYYVDLTPGVNDLGFLYENTQSDNSYYNDFKRVKVEFEQKAEINFEKESYDVICQNKVDFKCKVTDEPANIKYVWTFGNGEDEEETDEPEVEYTYKNSGDQIAECDMVSKKDGTVLATARAEVTAINLYGKWNLNYRITEAGAVDSMLNFIGDGILKIIKSFFPDQDIPNSANFSIEGTVIGGELTVSQPTDGGVTGRIPVVLQQQTSSTEYITVETTPISGYLTVKDDEIHIVLTGSAEDTTSAAGMKFDGQLNKGNLSGNFSAGGIMSGEFDATKQ